MRHITLEKRHVIFRMHEQGVRDWYATVSIEHFLLTGWYPDKSHQVISYPMSWFLANKGIIAGEMNRFPVKKTHFCRHCPIIREQSQKS